MTAADIALVVARTGHFLACLLLFGEALYVWTIDAQAQLRRRVIVAAVVLAVLSALGWLAVQAVRMSGETLRADTVGVVLHATQFGHVWAVRVCGVVMVGVAAWLAVRASTDEARRLALGVTVVLAGAHLALLALMGHASAASGLRRVGELLVDGVHLIAAGAWLGSLPALAATLASTASRDTLVRVTRRYSQVGYVAATAVVASGIVNAGFRDTGPVELVTTHYGRLLLVKLACVAAMVAVAAVNRFALTPRLPQTAALSALRRNAWLEVAIGIVVVLLVGMLGITAPPMGDMAAHAGMH